MEERQRKNETENKYFTIEYGNYQHIQSITADCDKDALVVRVVKDGPACHMGTDSCFTNPVLEAEAESFSMDGLYKLLMGRKENLPEGSEKGGRGVHRGHHSGQGGR